MDTALSLADPVSALNAILTLKACAAILGAEQMALYCTGLEEELRGHRLPRTGALRRLAADLPSALPDAIADTLPNDAKGPAPPPVVPSEARSRGFDVPVIGVGRFHEGGGAPLHQMQ